MNHNCTSACVNWVGTNKCHCSTCGRTFTGLSGFDLHRSGSKDKRFKQGECSDPVDRGLIQDKRGNWRSPEERDYDATFHR